MNQDIFIVYAEILTALGIITIINFNKVPKKLFQYVWIVLTVLPIVFFYITIFSFTDNIPFKDDYSLLESIYQMKVSSTFSEWSKAFFSQVNQHRFGFERSVMWLIYKVLGDENIKAQIIIGNSFLLGIFYLLFKNFKNLNLSFAYFTPIPLLLFNLTYFENAIWGIAAIQNTPIIFFALLAIHFLNLPNRNSLYWAMLFATITLFTSGNGIATWLVGIIILSLQKQWKKLCLWVLIMSSFLVFYFMYDYEIISSDRTNLFKHPTQNILYTFIFWGNIFYQNIAHPDVGHRYIDIMLCILTGIILLIIMIALSWKIIIIKFENLFYQTLTILGGMAFVAITGLMLVVSRPLEVNIIFGGEVLSRRYMLFGAVFACLGYLGFLLMTSQQKNYQKIGAICLIPIGIFLNVNSYYTSLSDVNKQQQELKLDSYYWKNHQMLLSFGEKYGDKIGYNHPTYMINLINNLDSSGIYKFSQNDFLPLVNLIKKSNSKTAGIFKGKIQTTVSVAYIISREKKAKVTLRGQKNLGNQNIEYFALKSQKNIFLMPAVQEVNSIYECLVTQTLTGSKFNYEFWNDKFLSGDYEIWVIEIDNQNNPIPLFCGKEIRL